jgi:hypothetical protein
MCRFRGYGVCAGAWTHSPNSLVISTSQDGGHEKGRYLHDLFLSGYISYTMFSFINMFLPAQRAILKRAPDWKHRQLLSMTNSHMLVTDFHYVGNSFRIIDGVSNYHFCNDHIGWMFTILRHTQQFFSYMCRPFNSGERYYPDTTSGNKHLIFHKLQNFSCNQKRFRQQIQTSVDKRLEVLWFEHSAQAPWWRRFLFIYGSLVISFKRHRLNLNHMKISIRTYKSRKIYQL